MADGAFILVAARNAAAALPERVRVYPAVLPVLSAFQTFLLLSLQLTWFVHDDAEALFQTGCRGGWMTLLFHDFAA
ncbi:MAG TPA: hypothetical protein VN283_11975 [Thiobacillus sp.]|nr:hypothetical protein [Thiobacillus sp.]